MSSKPGLGRGFDGLIPVGFDIATVATPGEQIKQLKIEDLYANPDQPRKQFDEIALTELATSIKHHGIIQPLVATKVNEKYRIVAGERRYRAAQIAGLKTVPVVIRNHAELEELEISLVENVQRVDLSPIEQAISILRLRDQFSLSLKDIASKLGKAETTISNIIRLLQLPKEVIAALQKNKISEGHARAILSLKTDEKAQLDLLNKIIAQKISVREAEQYVQQYRSDHVTRSIDTSQEKVLKLVRSELRKRVSLVTKKNGRGTIKVRYDSEEELKAILERL